MAGGDSIVRYALRRLLQAIPIVMGIAVLNFILLHLAPGDAADVMAGEAGSASPAYMAQLRTAFGLDRPLALQLLLYTKNVLLLNFGFSFRYDMPVLDVLLGRLWPTLLLMGTTFIVSVTAGTLLGLVAAIRVNSWRDRLISLLAMISYATPLFWVALMAVLAFALKLGWFPTDGMETVAAFYQGWDRVFDIGHHLVLPTMTLSLFYLALYARLMRASVLEEAGMDYVTTARAKGLSERRVVLGHVLRNAMLPVLTMAGVQAGALLGGSVVVESVFAWPGLGLLAFQALFARDLNLLMAIFFFAACVVVLINLVVDLVYTYFDPRIQLR